MLPNSPVLKCKEEKKIPSLANVAHENGMPWGILYSLSASESTIKNGKTLLIKSDF
jgi:hypothetical protein